MAATGPADRLVHLVYTGDLGGVGSVRYPLAIVGELWRVDQALDGHLAELAVIHGAAASGPWTLVAADRRAATLIGALQGGDLQCDEAQARPGVRTATELLVMSQPEDSRLLGALAARGLPREMVGWRDCTGTAGEALLLVGPPEALPSSWHLEDWELRWALMGRWAEDEPSRRFLVAAAPLGEPARLVTEARRRVTEEGALFVDAGSFLDGLGGGAGPALSPHRALAWQVLESLAPAALVPGETELALGARAFRDELRSHPLPYLATNWQAPEALELDDHRLVSVQTRGGEVRLAFVGVLDPDLHAWVPDLAAEGVSITDPVAATQAVVDRLREGGRGPDLVVALTTAGGAVQAELRRRLRGVDLLIGDPTLSTPRVLAQGVELRPASPGDAGGPLALGLGGLATAELTVHPEGGLAALRGATVPIGPERVPDPALTAAITRTRAALLPALDLPLVPAADPDAPSRAWTAEEWTELVCQALRRATRADAVLLRELPAPDTVPGPLSVLLASEQVAMLDRLELFRVPGGSLQAVLDRSWGNVPVACGAEPGASSLMARGRAVESGRVYRVVTSDRTRSTTPLGDILQGVPADGPLDPPGRVALADEGGAPWTIRQATLQALHELREGQADPDQQVRALLDEAESEPPQWLLRLRGLSASASRFQGADQDAFAQIPETLATSPTSFTVATSADLAVEYDDPGVTWDLRGRASYASLATAGSEVQESADDWRLSTSVELPALATRALLSWQPYSELLLDSELTPTLDADGARNERQADLSLAVGAAAGAAGPLSTLRLGAFASRDLGHLVDKPTEWGAKGELGTSASLSFLGWTTSTEGAVYADTAADDESDLRFTLLTGTKLSAPLARWLSLSLSAQAFLLQGRVPATQVVDGSWTLGATLDAAGAFALSDPTLARRR